MDPADRWWLSLSDDRRAQIYRWVDREFRLQTEVPGQQPLFPELAPPPSTKPKRSKKRKDRK